LPVDIFDEFPISIISTWNMYRTIEREW